MDTEPEIVVQQPDKDDAPWFNRIFNIFSWFEGFFGGIRNGFANILIAVVSQMAEEEDRKAIINWLNSVLEITASDSTVFVKVKKIYASINVSESSKLIYKMLNQAFDSYKNHSMPLGVKMALPVAGVGALFLGGQGAGIAALGGAIGMPVILLLFLGTIGLVSVIETLIKSFKLTDPNFHLIVMIFIYGFKDIVERNFWNTIKREPALPKRQILSGNDEEILLGLMKLDPFDFEKHVMSYFESIGSPTWVTTPTNDYGIDGATLHAKGLIVVQCKLYSVENKVGGPDVMSFLGAITHHKAKFGYFVTTSDFTNNAQKVAEDNPQLILINCDELLRWHRGQAIRLPDELR